MRARSKRAARPSGSCTACARAVARTASEWSSEWSNCWCEAIWKDEESNIFGKFCFLEGILNYLYDFLNPPTFCLSFRTVRCAPVEATATHSDNIGPILTNFQAELRLCLSEKMCKHTTKSFKKFASNSPVSGLNRGSRCRGQSISLNSCGHEYKKFSILKQNKANFAEIQT